MALQVLRTRKNAATGETPSAIILGYELPVPGEWQSQWSKKRQLLPPQVRKKKNRIVFKRQSDFQKRIFPQREEQPPV